MAKLKRQVFRKNAEGTYDQVMFESASDVIIRPSGHTVEQDLEAYLPRTTDGDSSPEALTNGLISTNNKRPFVGAGGKVEGLILQSDNPLCYEASEEGGELPPFDIEDFGNGIQRLDVNISNYTDIKQLTDAILNNTLGGDMNVPDDSMAIIYIDQEAAAASQGKLLPADFCTGSSANKGLIVIIKISNSDVNLNLYNNATNRFWYCANAYSSDGTPEWLEPYHAKNHQKVAYWS